MELQLSCMEVLYSQEKLQTHPSNSNIVGTIQACSMSMRKSSRSELRMLRMMVTHFGLITKCCFCKKPLLELEDMLHPDGELHIVGHPLPIKTKLTIHHGDGVHQNNADENRQPAHSTCHKRFHMTERQDEKRQEKNMKTKLAPEKVFVSGPHIRTRKFATVEQAEDFVAQLEKKYPKEVHAGDYNID